MGNAPTYIENVPSDIIRHLIQFIDLRSFENFTLAFPRLLDKYARLFRLFKEREEEPLKRIIAEYERYPDITIRMEDFFEAILKPKCQVQPPLLVVDRLIGECGNFAWHVYTFSVPPRRICFWGMHHDAEDVPCHPRLIKYLELEICQVYNLTPQDLTVLPKTRPAAPYLDFRMVDLQSLEELSERKHGKAKTKAFRHDLFETFPVRETQGWALKFSIVPKSRDRILPPLQCGYCPDHVGVHYPFHLPLQNSAVQRKYSYIPHDYNHLRAHFAEHHAGQLESLETAWAHLPRKIKSWWTSENDPSITVGGISYGIIPFFTTFWAGVRTYWDHRLRQETESHARWKEEWRGRLAGFGIPGWRDVDTRGQRPDGRPEYHLVMETWIALKMRAVKEEFEERWKDDRGAFWKESMEFVELEGVLGRAPRDEEWVGPPAQVMVEIPWGWN